jgi:hypothetical protein
LIIWHTKKSKIVLVKNSLPTKWRNSKVAGGAGIMDCRALGYVPLMAIAVMPKEMSATAIVVAPVASTDIAHNAMLICLGLPLAE